MELLPRCKTREDLSDKSGCRVEIEGIYMPVHVNAKKQDEEPVFIAKIFLDGGGFELLVEPFWHPGSIRTKDELEKFSEKKVLVVGTYLPRQPYAPGTPQDITPACYGGACIHPVESIAIAR